MIRVLLQSAVLAEAFLMAAGIYALFIDRESRYDIFDLLKGRSVTAAIGGSGVLGQTGGEHDLLRAVPLELNDTDVL